MLGTLVNEKRWKPRRGPRRSRRVRWVQDRVQHTKRLEVFVGSLPSLEVSLTPAQTETGRQGLAFQRWVIAEG
jgi:hypothetical protein